MIKELTQEQLDKIFHDITDKISDEMVGGVETIGDYGFKCAKEAWRQACVYRDKKIMGDDTYVPLG